MEPKVAALVLVDHGRFLGMDLTDRAAMIARRAGVECVHFAASAARIAHYATLAETLVVLDARTIVAPKAVRQAVRNAGKGILDLTGEGGVEGRFSRRIHTPLDIPEIERAYLSHTSGGSTEGFFTRQVRRFSIPISRVLLRHHVKANHVTLAGFAFAMAAGVLFAIGGYWAGVIGAFLYFFSTILDCSDGEVARGSFGESHYGAVARDDNRLPVVFRRARWNRHWRGAREWLLHAREGCHRGGRREPGDCLAGRVSAHAGRIGESRRAR